MDSDLEGKNILFYSEHDALSKEILGILEKSNYISMVFLVILLKMTKSLTSGLLKVF